MSSNTPTQKGQQNRKDKEQPQAEINLTQREIWDDSALLRAYSHAIKSYLNQTQEKSEEKQKQSYLEFELKKQAVTDHILKDSNQNKTNMIHDNKNKNNQSKTSHQNNTNKPNQQDEEPDEETSRTNYVKKAKTEELPSIPVPSAEGLPLKDPFLHNLLLSWYYTGYYTGQYEAYQQMGVSTTIPSDAPQEENNEQVQE